MVFFENVALLFLIVPTVVNLHIWLALVVMGIAVIKDALTALILPESALRAWGDTSVGPHILTICVILNSDLRSIRRDLHAVELDAETARLLLLVRVRSNGPIVNILRILFLTENFLVVKVCLCMLTLHESARLRIRIFPLLLLKELVLCIRLDVNGSFGKDVATPVFDLLFLLLWRRRSVLLDKLYLAIKFWLLAIKILFRLHCQIASLRVMEVFTQRRGIFLGAVFTSRGGVYCHLILNRVVGQICVCHGIVLFLIHFSIIQISA